MTLPRIRQAVMYYAACIVVAGMISPPAMAGTTWPASIAGRYKLAFNGFEVGAYQFQSQFTGKSYSASSSADISALFGAFKWKGTIQSQGTAGAGGPIPSNFAMNFTSKKKTGSIAMTFEKHAVKSYEVLPQKPPHPDAIPVKPDDLAAVLDPLSAILSITHATSAKPCDRTLPIFDGKTRFNLVMSYKGTEKITDKQPSGQPSQLVVCKVKYIPVSGHKPKDFADPWISYNAIEIALRPVPSANVFVTYRITVPTTIGPAVMSADKITITNSDNAQIALSQ